MYVCTVCGKDFDNHRKYGGHLSSHNRGSSYKEGRKKVQDKKQHICTYCNTEFDSGLILGGHVINCIQNPKYDDMLTKRLQSTYLTSGLIDIDKKCKKCGSAGSVLYHGKYCSECRLKSYPIYYSECLFKFNVYKYPDYFDLSLIEKYGWYSPKRNVSGVSRDHIFSASKGFVSNIDPTIIRHPANCRLMLHLENTRKNIRCDITLDELKKRIEVFDLTYRRVA